MLTELSIENFAIIDRLSLRFAEGLTVLTGETGAGKSIIIDAIQAALGARVPGDVVRADSGGASIEAIFDSPPEGSDLALVLAEYGIGDDDCLILRREISSSGRSTARINGRALPISVMSSIGASLVDIHGQSEHLSILRRDRQLEVLDRFAGLVSLKQGVSDALREYARSRRELDTLVTGQQDAMRRLDLLRFQVGEIESAGIVTGQETELAAERNLLTNAERLAELAGEAYEQLQGESGSVGESLGAAVAATRGLSAIDATLESLHERLETASLEVDDIAQELRRYRDAVEFDPQRLEAVEERLDLFTRLKRKYGATLEGVVEFGRTARAELEVVENFDDRVAELTRDVEAAGKRAGELAGRLSAERERAAHLLTGEMAQALEGLGLGATTFEARVERGEDPDGLPLPDGVRYAYSLSGIDTVTLLVSFNPGEPLHPLERVASGGETSRFLLALKSVLAGADNIGTLVFDEVDVGVGGRHGAVVAERLHELARSHQVLSITHLPQIAAIADHHVTVVKAVADGRTGVDVHALAGEKRIVEIAQMMSGTTTETARRNAKELLEAGRKHR